MKSLAELNNRFSTTGAPRWGTWLAAALTLGFYLRDLAHVLSALVAGRPPQLRDHDITALSPVVSLDEHSRVDVAARLLACSLGVGCLAVAGNAERPLFFWFLVANATVPLVDPALYASTKLR